jgi:hypothetical protein
MNLRPLSIILAFLALHAAVAPEKKYSKRSHVLASDAVGHEPTWEKQTTEVEDTKASTTFARCPDCASFLGTRRIGEDRRATDSEPEPRKDTARLGTARDVRCRSPRDSAVSVGSPDESHFPFSDSYSCCSVEDTILSALH